MPCVASKTETAIVQMQLLKDALLFGDVEFTFGVQNLLSKIATRPIPIARDLRHDGCIIELDSVRLLNINSLDKNLHLRYHHTVW